MQKISIFYREMMLILKGIDKILTLIKCMKIVFKFVDKIKWMMGGLLMC